MMKKLILGSLLLFSCLSSGNDFVLYFEARNAQEEKAINEWLAQDDIDSILGVRGNVLFIAIGEGSDWKSLFDVVGRVPRANEDIIIIDMVGFIIKNGNLSRASSLGLIADKNRRFDEAKFSRGSSGFIPQKNEKIVISLRSKDSKGCKDFLPLFGTGAGSYFCIKQRIKLPGDYFFKREAEEAQKVLEQADRFPQDVLQLITKPSDPIIHKMKDIIQQYEPSEKQPYNSNEHTAASEADPFDKAHFDRDQLRKILTENPNYLEKIRDKTHYTPLLYAVYVNKPEIVKMLIEEFGADIHAKQEQDIDALGLAEHFNNKNMIDVIKAAYIARPLLAEKERETKNKKIKDQKQEERARFMAVIKKGDISTIDKALQEMTMLDINEADEHSLTPLMVAASDGKKAIVDLLLALGAKANVQNKNGNTALHLAVFNSHYDVANSLVDAMKAHEIRVTNNNRNTVREIALKEQSLKETQSYKTFMHKLQKYFSQETMQKESQPKEATALKQDHKKQQALAQQKKETVSDDMRSFNNALDAYVASTFGTQEQQRNTSEVLVNVYHKLRMGNMGVDLAKAHKSLQDAHVDIKQLDEKLQKEQAQAKSTQTKQLSSQSSNDLQAFMDALNGLVAARTSGITTQKDAASNSNKVYWLHDRLKGGERIKADAVLKEVGITMKELEKYK